MDKPRKPRKSVEQSDSNEKEAPATKVITSKPSNKKKDQDKKSETGKRPEPIISGPNSEQGNKKKKQCVEENSRIPSTSRKRPSTIAQKPETDGKQNQAQPDYEESATENRSSKKRGSIKNDPVNMGHPTKSPSSEDAKNSNFVFQQVTSKSILKKEDPENISKRSSSFKAVRLGQSFDLLSGEKYKAKSADGFEMDKVVNDKLEAKHEVGSSSRSPEMTAVKHDPDRRASIRESHKNRITMVESKIAENKMKRRQLANNTSTASTVDKSGTEADVETIESEERTWDPETASFGGAVIIKKFQSTPEDIKVVLRESARYDLNQIDSDSDSDEELSRRTRPRQLSSAPNVDILNKNTENMTERERRKHHMNLRKYQRQMRLAEEARAEAERKKLEEKLRKYFLKEIVIDPKRPKKKKVDKSKPLEDDYDGDESSSIEFSQNEIPDIVRDILETRAELYHALNQEKEHESEEEGPTNDDLMLEDHLKLQKEIAAAIERQKEHNASDKELDHI